MLDCLLVWIVWPVSADWYREAVPSEYRRESRPKPATLDVDISDTGERLLRLVGSFPKAMLVLGEVAENLCVWRGCPTRMSGADVQHGLFRRFACPLQADGWTIL